MPPPSAPVAGVEAAALGGGALFAVIFVPLAACFIFAGCIGYYLLRNRSASAQRPPNEYAKKPATELVSPKSQLEAKV